MQKSYNVLGKTLSIIWIGVLSVLVTACGGGSKAPEHTKLIPKEAVMVLRLDIKQLTSKTIALDKLASKENLKEMGASDKEAEKSAELIKKFLDSGIDFLNKVYVFTDKLDVAKQGGTVGVVMAIDNEEKLVKFVKDDAAWKDTKKPEFKEEDKIKMAIFEGNKGILAWKGKVGVLLVKDGVGTADAKKLFSLKDNETLLGANESFKDATTKAYDASVWIDVEKASADNMQATMAMGMAGVSNKGTAFNLGFTFEKGKIVVDGDYTGNEEINKLNDKIANESVKGSVLKNIPIEEASVGFSFSLNLEGLFAYLKEKSLLEQVEKSLKELNLTSDDIAKALSGDVVGVMGKVNFDGKRNEMPEFVISLGIKDKKAFEKMIEAVSGKQKGFLSKKDNVYEAMGGMGFLVMKDDAAYITLTPSLKDGINKGESKLKGEFKEQASKYASVVYTNKSLVDSYIASKIYKKSAFGQVYGDKFPVEGGIIKVQKMKNKKSQTEIQVTMQDKSQNALLVLIEMAKKADEVQKLERKKWERDFDMDEPKAEEDEPAVLEEE